MWQKICKLVHVIIIFMDEPILCDKQNKLSRTSWQHIIPTHVRDCSDLQVGGTDYTFATLTNVSLTLSLEYQMVET